MITAKVVFEPDEVKIGDLKPMEMFTVEDDSVFVVVSPSGEIRNMSGLFPYSCLCVYRGRLDSIFTVGGLVAFRNVPITRTGRLDISN